MARFLSPEWFAQAQQDDPGDAGAATAVLEQVVEGGPDGTVVYRVEVAGDRSRLVWPVPGRSAPADLRLTCDWPTAVAVARGELSTQNALMQGRLRVSGNPGRLADLAGEVQGLDPLPAAVRRDTTYPPAP